jgi:hypothetical protein
MTRRNNTYRKPYDPVVSSQIRVREILQCGKAQGQVITRSSQYVHQPSYQIKLQKSATAYIHLTYIHIYAQGHSALH